MGVSGCDKSTTGMEPAHRLGWHFYAADESVKLRIPYRQVEQSKTSILPS